MHKDELTTEEIQKRCKTEIFIPDEEHWEKMSDTILEIEQEAFDGAAFHKRELKENFLHPLCTTILLKDTISHEIVGYACAHPVDEYEDDRDDAHETAYLGNIVISAPYQGHGLLGRLMQALEHELQKKGYRFLEQHARTDNNYANKIAKSYADRIVHQHGPNDSEYGEQMFFRIKL